MRGIRRGRHYEVPLLCRSILRILCLFHTVSDNRDSSIKSTAFHLVVSLETVSVTSAAPRAFP